MRAVREVIGTAVPLDRADVDTDQIIPAEWLKRVERTGFGAGLFSAWRKDPDFVLNDPRYAGASILVAGANFGCGSSREHAPWALEDYGFQAVIAPSFADIFRGNAAKIGLLTVELPADEVQALLVGVGQDPKLEITIDVEHRTVVAPELAIEGTFPLDDFAQHRLLNGLDDIGLTEQHDDAITAFESGRPDWHPSLPG
ncbi:MAG: 3-isopropylmalate dehydratase, small subunit [Actinomycetia bacterium]|nr:3-isopropylmalate dehydratase, small subunit [Actinomycetes bacterium]